MIASSRPRRWPVLVACGLVLLAGESANSQTVSKRLAVLEFKGGGIKGDVLDAFSDEVRGGAVDALAGRGVQVMTRENMLVLLKEMGKKDCSEGDCEVETARNIGADFVVSASVVVIDDEFVVTLKLHETKNGSLLATDRVNAKRKLDVLFKLREQGRKLVSSSVSPRPEPVASVRASESVSPPAMATTRSVPPTGNDLEVAKQHYKKAVELYDVGRWDEAIAEFQIAYSLRADPVLLFNMAQAYRLKGDVKRALDLYRNYLMKDPNSRAREDVERRIRDLQK
jgi:TolB-like protein